MSKIKDFVSALDGKAILVYGLGKSGYATANALIDAGANVTVGDDHIDQVNNLVDNGARSLDMEHDEFSDFAFLLLSPGVPLTHPEPHEVVKKATSAAVEIVCDIELFSRIYPEKRTVGVTGTNGKSTTVTLISHILNSCGRRAFLGGNIGTPIFSLDIEDDDDAYLIIEMSSFQIDLCPVFRPDIAVILNLTPDHLDRHGSMDNYMEVKERIGDLGRQDRDQHLIVAIDDDYTAKIYTRAKSLDLRSCSLVSTSGKNDDGVYEHEGKLFDAGMEIGVLDKLSNLKGIHNYQNAGCSYAVAKKVGISREDIWSAMESFPGLKHRQFLVRTINGVTYVNDSKSTNAAAAAVALGCRSNVYWIVGGRKKKNGLEGLEDFFSRIKHAFLIGESQGDFANWFDQYGMSYSRCGTLEKAVADAHKMGQDNRGQPGGAGVVLLSPACASFDQFDSFEARGDCFTELVNALDECV